MASSATAQAEPDWLVERRREGASLAQELALPDPKAKGWEFTDLSGLDLDAYAPAPGSAAIGEDGAPRGCGPTRRHERSGSHPGAPRLGRLRDDPFVARNEAEWRQGALVHVPAGRAI